MVTASASAGAWPPPAQPTPGAASGAVNTLSEPGAGKDDGFKPFGDDGFSFLDLIDVINPLQHLPVIGPLYRDFTGDTLDPLPRIAGSTLFFGPIGAGISITNVVVKQSTGKDMGGHVLAWFRDEASQTTTTADAGPITDDAKTLAVTAAGTDAANEDPVTAWARQELAYRTAEAERRSLIAGDAPPAQTQIAETLSSAVAPRPRHAVAELKPAALVYDAAAPGPPAGAETEKPTRRKLTTERALEPGAVGRDGGWFSTSMLGALEKYRDAEIADPSAIGARISETY